jgi:hypothetical protein
MTLTQKLMALVIPLATLLATTACSTPTYYVPAAGNEDPGYRDQKLDDKKYRISFIGNSSTARETVELYLLYRAAELTNENGFDYFVFSEHQVDAKTEISGNTMPSMYGGYGGYGRRGFPYYGMGTNISTQTHYESVAYITMYKGVAPEGLAHAFVAKEVLKNIGPRIERKPAKKTSP